MVDDVRGTAGEDVWRLRREVIQHPVHDWARGPAERTTLLVQKGFVQWASAALAASAGLDRPARHLERTRIALRREGAGRCVEDFLAEVDAGTRPVAAIAAAGAPTTAAPLAEIVTALLAGGSEAARLGAFAFGLPCCIADQGPALDRLVPPTAEATEGARAVLIAQVALYDGALQIMRRRQMTLHPSTWRSG